MSSGRLRGCEPPVGLDLALTGCAGEARTTTLCRIPIGRRDPATSPAVDEKGASAREGYVWLRFPPTAGLPGLCSMMCHGAGVPSRLYSLGQDQCPPASCSRHHVRTTRNAAARGEIQGQGAMVRPRLRPMTHAHVSQTHLRRGRAGRPAGRRGRPDGRVCGAMPPNLDEDCPLPVVTSLTVDTPHGSLP